MNRDTTASSSIANQENHKPEPKLEPKTYKIEDSYKSGSGSNFNSRSTTPIYNRDTTGLSGSHYKYSRGSSSKEHNHRDLNLDDYKSTHKLESRLNAHGSVGSNLYTITEPTNNTMSPPKLPSRMTPTQLKPTVTSSYQEEASRVKKVLGESTALNI